MKTKENISQKLELLDLINLYKDNKEAIGECKRDVSALKIIERNIFIQNKILNLQPQNSEELLMKVEFAKNLFTDFDPEDSLSELILRVLSDVNSFLSNKLLND